MNKNDWKKDDKQIGETLRFDCLTNPKESFAVSVHSFEGKTPKCQINRLYHPYDNSSRVTKLGRLDGLEAFELATLIADAAMQILSAQREKERNLTAVEMNKLNELSERSYQIYLAVDKFVDPQDQEEDEAVDFCDDGHEDETLEQALGSTAATDY